MPSRTPNVATMTIPRHAAIDTSDLVALMDSLDHWHARAQALREALKAKAADLVYFDPLLNEASSFLARRAHEQGVPPSSRTCWKRWIIMSLQKRLPGSWLRHNFCTTR